MLQLNRQQLCRTLLLKPSEPALGYLPVHHSGAQVGAGLVTSRRTMLRLMSRNLRFQNDPNTTKQVMGIRHSLPCATKLYIHVQLGRLSSFLLRETAATGLQTHGQTDRQTDLINILQKVLKDTQQFTTGSLWSNNPSHLMNGEC